MTCSKWDNPTPDSALKQARMMLLLLSLLYKFGMRRNNDGCETECGELLNWLCYVLTLPKDPSNTPTTLPPGSSLRVIGAALPMLRIDAPLQNHRWSILQQDLPVLDQSCLAPTDQVVHLFQVLRDEQAATHLAEVDNRKISMIFPLVSCCSCANNTSSF